MEFLVVPNDLTQKEKPITGVPGTSGAAGHSTRLINRKADCCPLLKTNYWVKMCEFRIQDGRHSPWRGLPQMAPWHHVGATMEITLDKNGSLYDPAGTESWNMQIRYETKDQIDSRLRQPWSEKNICAVLGLAACHVGKLISKLQVRPGDQPGYPKDTIESFVGHSSMGLLCPPALNLELERERTKEEKEREVLHLFRCYTHTHTWQTVCRLWATSCFPSRDLDILI